jgi:hypothetical protein
MITTIGINRTRRTATIITGKVIEMKGPLWHQQAEAEDVLKIGTRTRVLSTTLKNS